MPKFTGKSYPLKNRANLKNTEFEKLFAGWFVSLNLNAYLGFNVCYGYRNYFKDNHMDIHSQILELW